MGARSVASAPPGGLIDRLEREYGRRRIRLTLPTLYRNGVDELRALQHLIATDDPDWSPLFLAQLMIGSAGRAGELNAGIRERTQRPGRRLDIELEWIDSCRAMARQILDEGGTGTAGVREPRRPAPTPGWAMAQAPVETSVVEELVGPGQPVSGRPGWWRRVGA